MPWMDFIVMSMKNVQSSVLIIRCGLWLLTQLYLRAVNLRCLFLSSEKLVFNTCDVEQVISKWSLPQSTYFTALPTHCGFIIGQVAILLPLLCPKGSLETLNSLSAIAAEILLLNISWFLKVSYLRLPIVAGGSLIRLWGLHGRDYSWSDSTENISLTAIIELHCRTH